MPKDAKTVLIVEDERAIVEILKFNLARAGYAPIEAIDGEAGLKAAREADPDLILLDLMLPKLDGFEVCKRLRAEGNTVPILMLTAREASRTRFSVWNPARMTISQNPSPCRSSWPA